MIGDFCVRTQREKLLVWAGNINNDGYDEMLTSIRENEVGGSIPPLDSTDHRTTTGNEGGGRSSRCAAGHRDPVGVRAEGA